MEGLSGEWEDMNYRGIVDFMSGQRTVVRAESEWHLHDPHAEREGYMEVTGSAANPFAAPTDFDSSEPPTGGESARSGESDDWQFEPRPAMTSDGQQLGTVLYMTVYPADFRDSRDPAQVPPHQRSLADEEQLVLRQFDALDRADEPVPDDSRFHLRTLDVAHFEDPQQLDRFEADFRAALIPGLLDGPELASEVAKLEGLSGEWQERRGNDLVGFMNDRQSVVIDIEDWHPHPPNSERALDKPLDDSRTDIDF